MDINKKIAEELEIKVSQVEAAVSLIDEGNTIPFIARYRKEVTGSLDDEQLRVLDERLKYLRGLEDRTLLNDRSSDTWLSTDRSLSAAKESSGDG